MKFLKIFAFLVAAVSIVACSNDDKPTFNNKGGVTVSMEEANMSFLETKGIVRVPFDVKGERNGYVCVTCQVKEFGNSVAMEDVNYLVTDYTVNVDTMDNSGYFEVKIVDDPDPNEDRQFTVTLVSAEGATISGLETTIITIKDNDSDPYLRLAGEWVVPCWEMTGEKAPDRIVNLEAYDEGEPGYYKYYTLTGLLSFDSETPAPIKVDFIYNSGTQEGELSIAYNQELPSYDYAGHSFVNKLNYLFYVDGDGPYIGGQSGEAIYTWDEKARQISIVSWPGLNEVGNEGASFCILGYLNGSPATWFDDVANIAVMTKNIK